MKRTQLYTFSIWSIDEVINLPDHLIEVAERYGFLDCFTSFEVLEGNFNTVVGRYVSYAAAYDKLVEKIKLARREE